MLKLLLPLIALTQLSTAGLTAELTPAQRHADLEILHRVIAEDYGPLEQKKEKFGLDLGALTHAYEARLSEGSTDEDLRYLLMQYVAEFHDSHFSARVPSKKEARLGFTVDIVGNKILVEEIDRALLPESAFPFRRGDELVAFNGAPVSEEITALRKYNGMGREATARRFAAFHLTVRLERILPLPRGMARVGIRKRGEGAVRELSLPWIEKRDDEKATESRPAAQIGVNDWCSEKSRIAPPPGAEILSGVPFTAFIYPSPRGKIGFLRIPHYYPVDKTSGRELGQERFAQYEAVVKRMEAETVGLVVDQDFNCGGSIVYANKLLSLFLREPFRPAELAFRASQAQIDGLSRHLAQAKPSEYGYEGFRALIESIRQAKSEGRFMSRRIPVPTVLEMKIRLDGEETISPHPHGYSKPIVLLINEMSGSGGDLFPAMMKDLGRATLFGTTTMGAGGHTWHDPKIELPHSKLQINLTRSLIYRPNGALIENEGVEPHVPYEIGEEDFLGAYQPYLRAATKVLLERL